MSLWRHLCRFVRSRTKDGTGGRKQMRRMGGGGERELLVATFAAEGEEVKERQKEGSIISKIEIACQRKNVACVEVTRDWKQRRERRKTVFATPVHIVAFNGARTRQDGQPLVRWAQKPCEAMLTLTSSDAIYSTI